jgi:hypothetical protein
MSSVRDRIPLIAAWSALVLAMHAWTGLGASGPGVRPIGWQDVAPVQHRLESQGVTAATFASYVERVRQTNARRVREGDLDHLIFYLLQSTHFTKLPPLEPALSAKTLVENRATDAPPDVKARAAALLRALDSADPDARLTYFRELSNAAFPRLRAPRSGGQAGSDEREAALLREYLRVMRFLYEKEFVAQRSAERTAAVADLYRTRGLSTDTAVEAGFLVHQGLGILRALGPDVRIRRVLIVGPGLDLAPRTGLLEAAAPESYQPWAVVDALLALGLSRIDDLAVVGADINPRVVGHLRRARGRARTLTFVSAIAETDGVSFSENYREYFTRLGSALQAAERSEAESAKRARERSERKTPGGGAPGALSNADRVAGHLSKTISVDPRITRILDAERIDIVTERLTGAPFDLIVATNILPYFDEPQLALAMVNIAGMLAPGGTFLHNEGRPSLGDLTSALGLPLEQSRHAVIATVRGAPPLVDSVWLHRKVKGKG